MARGLTCIWLIFTVMLLQAAAALPTPISIHGTGDIPIDDVRLIAKGADSDIDYVSTVQDNRFLVTLTLEERFATRDIALIFINNESIVHRETIMDVREWEDIELRIPAKDRTTGQTTTHRDAQRPYTQEEKQELESFFKEGSIKRTSVTGNGTARILQSTREQITRTASTLAPQQIHPMIIPTILLTVIAVTVVGLLITRRKR